MNQSNQRLCVSASIDRFPATAVSQIPLQAPQSSQHEPTSGNQQLGEPDLQDCLSARPDGPGSPTPLVVLAQPGRQLVQVLVERVLAGQPQPVQVAAEAVTEVQRPQRGRHQVSTSGHRLEARAADQLVRALGWQQDLMGLAGLAAFSGLAVPAEQRRFRESGMCLVLF